MTNISALSRKPDIVISDDDHRILLYLALAGVGQAAEAADGLMSELERARVRPAISVPADVVRMGSSVRYRTDTRDERTVKLVYPAEADISTGAISVLTPVGTALLGLRVGQSISWTARDGRLHALTVIEVHNGASPPDGDDGPAAA